MSKSLDFYLQATKAKDLNAEFHLESDSYTLVFMSVARLRVDSFATYAYSCSICALEFFVLFLGLKTIQKFQQANTKAYAYVANESTLKPVTPCPKSRDVGSTHEGLYSADISLFQQKYPK